MKKTTTAFLLSMGTKKVYAQNLNPFHHIGNVKYSNKERAMALTLVRSIVLVLLLPFTGFAQLSGVKKGSLAPVKDLKVQQYFKVPEQEKYTGGKVKLAFHTSFGLTRANHDLTNFIFLRTQLFQCDFLLPLHPYTPSEQEFFNFKKVNVRSLHGNSDVMSLDSTIAFEGKRHQGTSFMQVNNLNDLKLIGHVIVEQPDKSWTLIDQSYYDYTNDKNEKQIIYAAAFHNAALKKQIVKGWRLQDLPDHKSWSAIGLQIVKDVFKDLPLPETEKGDASSKSGLIKTTHLNQSNALFTFEESYQKPEEKINHLRMWNGRQENYFGLIINRGNNYYHKNDEFWIVPKAAPASKLVSYDAGKSVDNKGYFYSYTVHHTGKKYIKVIEVHNILNGEKVFERRFDAPDVDDAKLVVDPGGKYGFLYSTTSSKDAFLYDLNTGKQLCKIAVPDNKERGIKKLDRASGEKYICEDVRFSEDGTRLSCIWVHHYSINPTSVSEYVKSAYLSIFDLQ